jgi:A/G-specific adenine glycosylase
MAFAVTAIATWYQTHGRHDLPWRNTADPYKIYISEVMLQQTQVQTVLARFYHPFLEAFPSLQALAEASEASVLKQWEGLGYYSRARNLHRAAQITAPALPRTIPELLALPGIGRNTAHAIAALAYRQPVAVLEANVKRVIARLMAWEQPSEAQLWEAADALLNRADPFTHNQAMMDIGSLICTPRAPQCALCPLASQCQGKHTPERYPTKTKRAAVPIRRKRLWVITDSDGRFLLCKRESRFLGGLYGFPETDAALPLPAGAEKLGHVQHSYSHFMLDADVYHLPLSLAAKAGLPTTGEWVTATEADGLALSRADMKAKEVYTAFALT